MKNSNNALSFIISITIIGILIYLIVLITPSLFDWISKNNQISIPIITAVISLISILCQKSWELRYKTEQQIKNKKMKLYSDIISEISYFFSKTPSSLDMQTPDPDLAKDFEKKKSIRFAKVMLELNHKIIAWGSDDVLKAWSEIKKTSYNQDTNPNNIMFAIEKLIYAMRKDLGHKNYNLFKGDILSLWFNDVNSVLSKL
jgi:hypothetical protein